LTQSDEGVAVGFVAGAALLLVALGDALLTVAGGTQSMQTRCTEPSTKCTFLVAFLNAHC
jgi:hypothetical protein